MKDNLTRSLMFRVVLPPVLGALGALAAVAVPAYHAAFCAGRMLGG